MEGGATMKLKIQQAEDSDSIFVTVNPDQQMAGGFFGTQTVEVRPGQVFMTHPYRRLKRWCGKNAACERTVADPHQPPVEKPEQVDRSVAPLNSGYQRTFNSSGM
jgi:hypothetical protein